jgi:tetratricopeptide (TPR) repeat protein
MTSSNATSIQVGSYQLGARLGEGGSSEVYRAVGPDGAEVAIKLLGPHAELDDDRARRRFVREIALVGELDHPHLVKLLDAGDDPELGPYLVTELHDGPSLRELAGGDLACGPDVAALLVAPIAEAVAALHRASLVHRDLKPENVIATAAGDVVLIDLGLARRPGHTRYTDEGEVVGSVPYMAPEQIEGGEVTGAADVWALGVMLYELTCGARPFFRERPSEEAAAALVGAREPIARRDRRVSPELAALIGQCLAADPAARPDAAGVVRSLGAEIDGDARDQRAAWFADRRGFEAALSHRRAAELADRATAARGAFEALALIDRGLAYAPDDPRLREAATRATEAAAPTPRRRWPWIAGALGGAGLIAVAVALAAIPESADDLPEPLALTPPVDPEQASQQRSEEAARRVASGFGQLMMRGLAAERDESGKLIARQGGPGEASNEELTLAVFGGLIDLFEEGVEAKKRAPPGSETITLAALDPSALSDSDKPRAPVSLEAGDEPLVHLEGTTADQIRVMTGELERRLGDTPDDPRLRVSLAIYEMAGGAVAGGERRLAALIADAPRFAPARVAAALVASRRGDRDAALAHLDAALAADADSADALALRGRIRFHLGQTASAYRDLRRAIEIDSTTADAVFGLAELYHAAGADPSPLIDQLRALAARPSGGAKAARRLRELCDRGVSGAC